MCESKDRCLVDGRQRRSCRRVVFLLPGSLGNVSRSHVEVVVSPSVGTVPIEVANHLLCRLNLYFIRDSRNFVVLFPIGQQVCHVTRRQRHLKGASPKFEIEQDLVSCVRVRARACARACVRVGREVIEYSTGLDS